MPVFTYAHKLDGKFVCYSSETCFYVQTGKGKSTYNNKYVIKGNLVYAVQLYNALSIHSGYKARLMMDDTVLARKLSQ